MRILVTGATGFVGDPLCRKLRESGHTVVAAVRNADSRGPDGVRIVGDIGASPPWDEVLPGFDAVIHLAALVHRMGGDAPPLDEYRRVNRTATEQLAQACVRQGVRRLVFLSSVKVNGECSPHKPFTEADEPRPEDAYGISKHEAERALAEVAAGAALETVIVRPPLVYGPGVRANFRRLLRTVHRVNPLLVPRLASKRSLVGIGNLVAFLSLCASHPAAAGHTFLVSDREDVSASELMARLAVLMGHRAFQVPAPARLLRLAARALGREQEARRILDPLTVSSDKAVELLSWSPPFHLNAGLELTIQWYLSQAKDGSEVP